VLPEQYGKQRTADHPAQRNVQPGPANVKDLIELKITHRFDQTRKHESERENERRAVMRAAETNQGVGRVTKTQKRAADFQIKIGLIISREIRAAEISHAREKRQP
jgi:hypothetical protein